MQKIKGSRGNWDQNDPTADDYIKNRPFYEDESGIHKIDEKSAYVVVVNNNDNACPLNPEMKDSWHITEVIYGDVASIKGHDCLICKIEA